ncbi:MAG TPA: error-prone DNA polymerase [Gammaproteobacteria bacterium]|nr:error-prone DNA polymerase [Gammaproteobacteria bacterium]
MINTPHPSSLPEEEGIKNYAELHALSNFSFLRGASHPAELVDRAVELGYTALALTDECSVAGLVRAHLAAKEKNLHLIAGSEFSLDDGTKLILLAENRRGYGLLCSLITRARRRSEKGRYSISRADFEGLSHCLALWTPDPTRRESWRDTAQWIKSGFGDRAWIAVELLLSGEDAPQLAQLQQLGQSFRLPLVASGDVHMHVRARRRLQDTLTAIRLKQPLSAVRGQLYANGERHLRSRARLARLYPPALLAETGAIAARCTFSLDELRYEYPEEITPAGLTPAAHLRALTDAGAARRWPNGASKSVREQIERELALIAELRYEPYFLTVHDIVNFARSRGILCQGRGSAANSAICYCLGITELDPAQSNLLFERFISKERAEPPDIDVDFEHERREEVIQYIYKKYSRERAALAATLITYHPKSAVRDVGKALGLDALQVDKLAKALQWWDGGIAPERLREAGLDPSGTTAKWLLHLVGELIGFPRHLSQHVGGFVISRGPLAELVPVENAAMPERTVIQWDKDDLDAVGLLKVDVLALGMLTALKKALDLVNSIRGNTLTLSTIPAEDSNVYDMLQRADTIGLFQVESRAQMAMLPRLKPKTYYDLVIQVAIVRPGPIQGDMVHPFLARRRDPSLIDYPGPAIEKILKRTLGVPIFQEQVMQIAIDAADFTPGEADQLRRAMGAWKRTGSLGPFQRKLKEGLRRNGYSEAFANQLYRQIEGFGEYGFPESHSASFALLAYASAWLKYYEPAAFTCALLNSQPMGFYAPAQLVGDARRHGVEVRPVDVMASEWECMLETDPETKQPALRLGLCLVKGLSEQAAHRMLAARADQLFTSAEDLGRRADLDRRDWRCLVDADALKSLSGHRHRSAWQALGIEPPLALGDAPVPEAEPLLTPPTEGRDIVADYASVGLTLNRHPLALLRKRLARERIKTATAVSAEPNGRLVRVAGLVTHRQRPGNAQVTFVTLEDETGYVNIIVRPSIAEQNRRTFIASQLLGVTGIIQREGNVLHVLAGRLADYSALLGDLVQRSRDFR